MVAKSGIEPVNGVFELCSKSSLLVFYLKTLFLPH